MKLMGKRGKRGNKRKHSSVNIIQERTHILGSAASFSLVENYKAIRTNLMFSTTVEGCKIIGITSAEAGEGKSITSLNIAITFGELDKRVLLLDCDLRRPKIARLLGLQASPGISNVLANMNSLNEVIRHVKLERTTIDVISSGDIPPNPSELLGSQKMSTILDTLAERYDYIFVDTTPINVVSDTMILSKKLTGIVLLVRQGRTEQGSVLTALSQLKYAEANILGFLLNGVGGKGSKSYGKYKYKYNSYGYGAPYVQSEKT